MENLNIYFSNWRYMKVHKCVPEGRGSWVFKIKPNGCDTFEYKAPAGTLTEAKKFCEEKIMQTLPADFSSFVRVDILP